MLFYDVKAKKKFNTDKFEKIQKKTKKGRTITMGVADSPHSDIKAYRILSNKPTKCK